MTNDTQNPCDDLDVKILALHADADFSAWMDEQDAARNALSEEPEDFVVVREHPEYEDLTDLANDSLGQIDAAEADDFLAYIAEWFGTSEWWHVDDMGRIFLTRRISAGEAQVCGCHIVKFLAERGVPLTTAVDMVPTGEAGTYKPVIVSNGTRKPLPYNVCCGTVEAARAVADEMAWQYGSTVVPAGYVAVASRGTEGRAA